MAQPYEDEALTPEQQLAVEWMVTGRPDTEVAALIGVSRWTVWRWKDDPAFAAALQRRHGARRAAVRELIAHTDRKALEVLISAIDAGSLRAATAYLRMRAPHLFALPEEPVQTDEVAAFEAVLGHLGAALRDVVPTEAWGEVVDRVRAAAAQLTGGGST